MYVSTRSRFLAVGAAVLALTIPCSAATVRRMTLTEIRDSADRIVVGVVFEKSTRVGETGKMVWTDYRINVVEILKGEQQGQFVTLSFAGGQSGDLDTGVVGVPVLEIGTQYLFFVDDERLVPAPTIGWGQGLFEFVEAKVGGRDMTVLLSHEGEALQMTAGGSITRGPRMMVRDGELIALQSSRGQRMASPIVLNADGSVVPARRPAPVLSSKAAPRFASLGDVRQFARDKIRERKPEVR